MSSSEVQVKWIFLVRSTNLDPDDGVLWWSNEGGWTSLDQALVYTETESATLNLPFGGEWVRFVEADRGSSH